MKTSLLTIAVIVCTTIDRSQGRLMEFSNMFSTFFSPMPSVQSVFQTVCDADMHACIQRGSSLAMSSEQSSTSTYYNLCTGSSKFVDGEEIPLVEVRDRSNQLIASVIPGTYMVNGKNVKAWDLRKYTMGNYDLKASPPTDCAILTYYSGFQVDNDNSFDSFF
ncbi:uncharacterized protein LOC116339613 [Contarinia nasturtii]|uniref:uncharacterized protein LOC116339613 n=1 Tax=Contarinia nasturtii TaxID=265458 RepID=UPI0012D3A02E|nr:uncharacterized protein LOC116339613 [Contarinia nasturtii]